MNANAEVEESGQFLPLNIDWKYIAIYFEVLRALEGRACGDDVIITKTWIVREPARPSHWQAAHLSKLLFTWSWMVRWNITRWKKTTIYSIWASTADREPYMQKSVGAGLPEITRSFFNCRISDLMYIISEVRRCIPAMVFECARITGSCALVVLSEPFWLLTQPL